MLAATPLDARFERPADFDALSHLTFSLAALPRAHAVEVLLHTDLAGAHRELFDAIGLFEPVGDAVLLHSQVDALDWSARELARVSFGFEIRRPAALGAAVRAHGERLIARVRSQY